MKTAKNILLALVLTLGGATTLVAGVWALCQFFIFITEKWGPHAVLIFLFCTIGVVAFAVIFSNLQEKRKKTK